MARLARPRYCSDADRPPVLPGPTREPYAQLPGSLVINQGAAGIGDGLQGLLAIGGLRADGFTGHITYRVGQKAIPFVGLFEGFDLLAEHDNDSDGRRMPDTTDRQLNRDYQVEMATRGELPRWERYRANVGASRIALPTLRHPELFAADQRFAGAVVLCPFTASGDRDYGLPGWREVDRLLRRAGYPTVLLHNRAWASGFDAEQPIGQSPEQVLGILRNAACVIGSDSGLSHLAGILGTPTVILSGQTRGESVYGCYPRASWLNGPLSCHGCYWLAPKDDGCSPRCPSIQAIQPATIAAAVDAWILPAIAGGRSLVSADRLVIIRGQVLSTNHLAGDVAELGVYRGGTARLIQHFAGGTRLHLFDTFAGIPADDADGEHKAGDFPADLAEVQALVPGAILHVGTFPETAPDDATRYRFVHLDGDTYQTTAAGLDWFGPRMVAGGVMVLDDYGWRKCPGVARALHERFDASRITSPARHQAVVQF